MKTFKEFNITHLSRLRERYDKYFLSFTDYKIDEGYSLDMSIFKTQAVLKYTRHTIDEAIANNKEADIEIIIPDYLTPELTGKMIQDDTLTEEQSGELLDIATVYLEEYGFEYN